MKIDLLRNSFLITRRILATPFKMDENGATIQIKPHIQTILENYASENSIKVSHFGSAGVKRNNFLSDVIKCTIIGTHTVNGKEEDYKASFVVKELPADPGYVKLYNCDTAFKNEVIAYKLILPNLKKMAAKPLPVPDCIHAANDVIILEDFSEAGFEHLDKLKGFTKDAVKLILAELANLHGSSLILRHQNPELFTEISTQVEEVLYRTDRDKTLLDTQESCMEMVVEIAKSRGDLFAQPAIEALQKLQGNTHQIQHDLLTTRGKYAVINHGDMWCNNILKRGSDIRLIDFQVMRCTSLGADLNYFFYVNLDPDFRLEHKDEFLEFYLGELLNSVKHAQLPFESDLNLAWLKQEVDRYAFFGFICGLWVMPVFYQTLDNMEKSASGFLEHNATPAQDAIEKMVPEQKDRLIKLICSYANIE